MEIVKVLVSSVFLLGLIKWPLVSGSGATAWFEDDLHLDGNCKYTGYIPGGGIPNIQPITAPVAKLPGNALAEIAGVGEKGTKMAETALKVGEAFAKSGSALAAAAPGVGAALAVVGAGFGFLSDEFKVKPEDILKAVNKAFKELTDAINDRLEQMKGYIDQKIINLKKQLVNNEYTMLFERFTDCIDGPQLTKKEVDKCVMRVETTIKSSRVKFMPFRGKMKDWNAKSNSRLFFEKNPNKAPSFLQVKEMEAILLTFRDFANLHLLVLSSLVNTFKKSGPKKSTDFYVKRKKYYAQRYARYAKWVRYWTLIRNVYENKHVEDNQFNFKCGEVDHVKEGSVFKVHTINALQCSMECTGMFNGKAPIKECRYKVELRVDDKEPAGYVPVKVRYYDDKTPERYARQQGRKLCHRYSDSLLKDMKTYYGSVLDDNVKVWEKMAAKQGA